MLRRCSIWEGGWGLLIQLDENEALKGDSCLYEHWFGVTGRYGVQDCEYPRLTINMI